MSSIDAVLRAASPLQSTAGWTPSSSSTSSSSSSSLSSSLTSLSLAGNSGVGGSSSPSGSQTTSWYEALAQAWGQSLNNEAQTITTLSNQVSNSGQDQPSQITQLTAESMRFSFLASDANTSTTSVGEALQTLGRKD
jgi:hypothetical protein